MYLAYVRTARRMDNQTDDGQKVKTTAHPEHSSGELIMKRVFCMFHKFHKKGPQVLVI